MKRCFDIVFSTVVLITGIPLFLLLALLVKLTSKGPIFYGSLRKGLHGKDILCWKFRTMDSKKLQDLFLKDLRLQEEWNKNHKLKNDLRVTFLGHYLRKSSLDELPQFWNVLKGDLSVVGPRPVTEEELTLHFKDKKEKILSIRPGLTGIWQTSGRNLLPYETRVRLDEEYVDNHSFFFDLKLIVKTIPVMIFSKGAF